MTKNEGNGKERRRYIYIFWTSRGVFARSLMREEGEDGGSAAYQVEVNSVEYAPLTQRVSKAAHMEHINPNESNQKRQTRTQPHRDPNEQSDGMNPKKKEKEEEVLSQPKATGISQKEHSSNCPIRSRRDEAREEKARRALLKHARTHYFKPSFQEQRRRGEK